MKQYSTVQIRQSYKNMNFQSILLLSSAGIGHCLGYPVTIKF